MCNVEITECIYCFIWNFWRIKNRFGVSYRKRHCYKRSPNGRLSSRVVDWSIIVIIVTTKSSKLFTILVNYIWRSSSRLQLEKSFRCFSTTCSKYCICVSSLVDALNFWINATPLSATSLMHTKCPIRSVASLNDCVSDQTSTGKSRKLSSMPAVSKNVREMDKSAAHWGSFLITCEPRSYLILDTNFILSSADRSDENRPTGRGLQALGINTTNDVS